MVRMVEINDSQFNTLVLKSSLPVLIECTSPECIICKTMAERIQEASKDHLSKMVFFRLNINENKKWKDFNVRVIPTLLYFKDGILVARQDSFPETREIREQIHLIAGHDVGTVNVCTELKAAADLEYVAAKFYKYVYSNSKNGSVKEKFRLIHQETVVHKELLQEKLRELTGSVYTPGASYKFEGPEVMKPQSFSLIGAMKMAVKIEEKLLGFYKRLNGNKLFPDKDMCKRLIKEESAYLKALRKEMKFIQNKELFSSMETAAYPTWLNKVFD